MKKLQFTNSDGIKENTWINTVNKYFNSYWVNLITIIFIITNVGLILSGNALMGNKASVVLTSSTLNSSSNVNSISKTFTSKVTSTSEQNPALKSSKSWSEKDYVNKNLNSTGVEGFLTGDYVNVYRMNVRPQPTTNGTNTLELLQAFSTFNVIDIVRGNDGKIWGKMSKGWVCLEDDQYVYCYGPGNYKALNVLKIYKTSSINEPIDRTIEKDWEFTTVKIFNKEDVIWAELISGDYVILSENQKAYIGRG